MKYLLGLDVETSGLDVKKGKILEIGAVLFHIPTKAIIAQASTLLSAHENPVEHINLISVPMLQASCSQVEIGTIDLIKQLIKTSDAIVAHHAIFDRTWIEAFEPFADLSKNKKWICTRKDISWPGMGSLKLQDVARRMGVPYVDAHRSIPDVHIMLECLRRLPDLEQQLSPYAVAV